MPARRSTERSRSQGYGVVVVGASWGGLEALTSLVRGLPDDFPVPVVVIQHRGRDSKTLLADLLQDRSRLQVSEPDDKEPLQAGHVYVAPSDYHLLVDVGYLSLEMDAPVRYSRPSIDVTFSSAADSYGPRAIGVVLTGANADGAIGLRSIVDAGGIGIVQDPDSAEMPVMPRAARLAVPEATVLPVEKIAPHLVSLAARAAAGARTR
jgi:two-component system, chemotaxis family, protein-glutamate methylesterase/glutaminase